MDNVEEQSEDEDSDEDQIYSPSRYLTQVASKAIKHYEFHNTKLMDFSTIPMNKSFIFEK